MKNEKATTKTINKNDNKRCQNATTLTVNHEEIRKHSQRATKAKYFIDKYNWKDIKY